jgi:YVTN family beta-propeller protein
VDGLPAGTVTFLFTDIEGSTELLKRLGSRYSELLVDHARILREAASSHGGREVDNQGDSFFFAFARANAALAAAVVAQRALAEQEWPDGAEVRVRMGLHTGEPTVGDERYVGLGVHRAARIGAAAHGGQVLLSNSTRELVEDEVDEVAVRELGVYRLKDIDRPELLYQLDIGGRPSEFPPLRAEKVDAVRPLSRRPVFLGAVAAVIAAAIAVPLFAFGGASPGLASVLTAHVAGDAVGVFDLQNASLTTQVPVEKRPSAIAVGAGAVWVANVDDDSVSEVDPETNQLKQTISVGNGPSGIVVGGCFVWVANYLGRSISQIDPRTSQVVQVIQLTGAPSGVAFGHGGLWVADASDRSVLRIDPASDKAGKPIPVDAGAAAIAYGFGALWVAGQDSASITKLDPSSGNAQPINVGSGPAAIAIGAGSVWVANSGAGTVSRIDPASNGQASVITVGFEPSAVAVTGDGSSVWVANTGSGTLSRIDPSQNRIVQTVTTGNHPDGIGLSGSALYLAVRAAGNDHRGGTLTVVRDGVLEHDQLALLDPAISYIIVAWQVLMITNDGLVTFQHAGGSAGTRLVPDLATSLPTPTDHGRTYTFQVRRGIRYSNGRVVAPADFRRAIERALVYRPPDGGGPGPTYFGGIVGAAACLQARTKPCDLSKGIVTGADTVSFHLLKPDPDFLFKLAEPTADAEPASTPLAAKLPLPATGPYELASYSASKNRDVYTLVRNPRFREWSAPAQPAGYPDRIVLELRNTSVAANVRSVLAGRADLTDVDADVPSALDLSLHTRYAAELHSEPTLATSYITLNTRVPPFDSLDARRAVAFAIDRKRLVQLSGGRDLYEATCQLLPLGLGGYRRFCPYSRSSAADGGYRGPDLAEAKRLVAASGTKGMSVVLNFGAPYVAHSPLPAYLLSLMRELGYRARIRVVSGKQYGSESFDPHFKWQLLSGGWYSDWPSASSFFSPLTCASFQPDATNQNFSEFCDRGMDAEIARAQSLQLVNPQAAARIWAEVDRTVVDQAPVVPFVSPRAVDLTSARVGNYVYSLWIGDVFLDQLWVR